jgi:predicted enzyme related to lactoylglutathione lyase
MDSPIRSERSLPIRYSVEMPNPIVHFEIGCRDSVRTQKLYRELFDWTIDVSGPAANITGAGISGHITALGHEPFHYTTFYVQVDDVAAHIAKAESLGCKKLVGPVPIPTGTFAWITDPDGNTIGLFKPAKA